MVYINSTPLGELAGKPVYLSDVVDACLYGRLNLFLQGDTGSGKTQLAVDAMSYFPEDRSLFILGRNDMDVRELFQRINLGKLSQKPAYNLEPLVNPDSGEVEWYYPKLNEQGILVQRKLSNEQADRVKKRLETIAGTTEDIKELTSRINTNLIIVDELPNCVPAVRSQLFNLFDGYIEINGKVYQIGSGYSLGISTGNIGQHFTESSNDLGRALKDRMHVTIDVDYFFPKPVNTFRILDSNTNPKVSFSQETNDGRNIIEGNKKLEERLQAGLPAEKLIIANYLIHGLDFCSKGSKRKMKDAWPNFLDEHEQGSDVRLILPVSPRAAKSILRLSESFDLIAEEKGVSQQAIEEGYFDSMMLAFKLVGTYSGILDESAVINHKDYAGNKYAAIDAICETTREQFQLMGQNINRFIEMTQEGKSDQELFKKFSGRWEFMRGYAEFYKSLNSTLKVKL